MSDSQADLTEDQNGNGQTSAETEANKVERKPLQPTTFADDAFGLDSFADTLENYLLMEKDYVDGSLVVTLDSDFGSGKSTFLRMWHHRLVNSSIQDFLPVELNAWETDFAHVAVYPIISSIAEAITDDKLRGKFLEAVKAVLPDLLGGLPFGVGTALSSFSKGAKAFSNKETAKAGFGSLPDFDIFAKQKQAVKTLNKALTDIIQESQTPILVMIDELDRCRPNYAIEYLETVKHLFNVQDLIFILAVSKSQMRRTAGVVFGEFNGQSPFDEFLRKYVHREISLPEVSKECSEKYARMCSEYFLGKRNIALAVAGREGKHSIPEVFVSRFIRYMKITPRQAQNMVRYFAHLCSASKERDANTGIPAFPYTIACMFMYYLKISKPILYSKIGAGVVEVSEIMEVFVENIPENDNTGRNERAFWVAIMSLFGIFGTDESGRALQVSEVIEDIESKYPDLKEAVEREQGLILQQTMGGLGSHNRLLYGKVIKEIYDKIENVAQWD